MQVDYPENWWIGKGFNAADWLPPADGFPSLRNYARIDVSNVWLALQRFPTLEFVYSINSIPAATFAYLSGVTSSIQSQFDNIAVRLRHLYTSDDATAVEGTLVTNQVAANQVAVNDLEAGTARVVDMTATTLRAHTIVSNSLTVCWLFDDGGRSYPLPHGTTLVPTLTECNFKRGAVRVTLPPAAALTLTTSSGVVLFERTNSGTATLHRIPLSWNGVFIPSRLVVR